MDPAILERALSSVIRGKGRHVPVVTEVDNDVGLFVGDELSDPLKVICPYSRAYLGIGNNNMLPGFTHSSGL
jgi:hypothetical protein